MLYHNSRRGRRMELSSRGAAFLCAPQPRVAYASRVGSPVLRTTSTTQDITMGWIDCGYDDGTSLVSAMRCETYRYAAVYGVQAKYAAIAKSQFVSSCPSTLECMYPLTLLTFHGTGLCCKENVASFSPAIMISLLRRCRGQSPCDPREKSPTSSEGRFAV